MSMVYLLGLNFSKDIAVGLGLKKLYGIGLSRSKHLCDSVGIDYWCKMGEVPSEKLRDISRIVRTEYVVGVELKREIHLGIRREMDSRSYKGLRHRYGLCVNGQRTRSNGRTAKRLLLKKN